MSDIERISCEPWAPHPTATPLTTRADDGALTIAANGSGASVGGWQLVYQGARPGASYRVAVDVSHDGVVHPRDELECVFHWETLDPRSPQKASRWTYLLPTIRDGRVLGFERTVTAPPGATRFTIRFTLRWGRAGSTRWSMPRIEAVERVPARKPVRVCVVTGAARGRDGEQTLAGNRTYYLDLVERACHTESPQLVLTPEVCLQWRVPGSALDVAVQVDGPEVQAFARLAREHATRIVLGANVWVGDTCHNSALLIGPDGRVDGRYDKVHLAVLNESDSGVRPGEGFPVFDTEVGRLEPTGHDRLPQRDPGQLRDRPQRRYHRLERGRPRVDRGRRGPRPRVCHLERRLFPRRRVVPAPSAPLRAVRRRRCVRRQQVIPTQRRESQRKGAKIAKDAKRREKKRDGSAGFQPGPFHV